MEISWPDALPDGFLADGFSQKPQSNVLRTKMDAGPKKARRRYTARTVNYTGKQIFTREEMALFENFYHNELADGALRFVFTDPVTLEKAEFRFTEDYSASEKEGCWETSLPLERL